MKNKTSGKFIYLVLLAAIIVCFSQGQAKAAQASALKIGLYISDDRILIYSGADKHLTIGLKLNVVRNKRVVATVELIDVRASFSVAKVVSKIDDLADGDELYYPSAMPVGSKSGGESIGTDKTAPIGEKTAEAKAKDTTKKTDTAAADKKKDTAKTATSTRRDAAAAGKESTGESGEDKKPANKSKTTTASKDASKTDTAKKDTAKKDTKTTDKKDTKAAGGKDAKADDKKDAKEGDKDSKAAGKNAKAGGKDSKAAAPPKSKSYPTELGFSGLWTVPTAEVAAHGKTGFSIFRSAHSYSSNGISATNGGTLSYNYFDSKKTQTYSVNYGIGWGMEATFAHGKEDYNMSDVPGNSFSFESDLIGVKYQLKKKLLLDAATKKQWVYAIGAVKQSYGLLTKSGDKATGRGSVVYGVVSAPVDSFFVHLSVAYVKNNGARGRKTSSSAGLELPLSSNVTLLGEADLFQAEYTYNTALRFSSNRDKQNMALLLGYGDITGQRDKSLGFSLKY